MRRIDCHDSIKRVKGSYDAALKTVKVLLQLGASQPHYLYERGLDLTAMQNLSKELHDVYFVRIFASFESSIRDFWRTTVRNTRPLTEHLVNSVADRQGIPEDVTDTVHEIRNFRNYLIHGDHELSKPFTIDAASKTLNTYLARLPLE